MRLRDFFYLHHSDRQVILTLLVLAAIVVGVIYIVGHDTQQVAIDANASADSPKHVSSEGATQYYAQPSRPVERFPFDPNTADSTQLLRLGLQPWQVRNIYKYRAAGGIYRTKADFARLYGLTVKQYSELEPYIVISSDYQPASTLFADQPAYGRTHSARSVSTADSTVAERYHRPHKIAAGEHVDLNAADTAIYQSVPGIGSYYARKIAEYGHRLGGYVSIDQLDEIDNFPSEAKSYFALLSDSLHQLNVNRLSLNELRRHPYINYYQAKAIVDYRRLHGPLSSLDDLSLLSDFSAEDLARLAPYVTFQ